MTNEIEYVRTGLDEYTQKELTEQEAHSLVDLFRSCYPAIQESTKTVSKWCSEQYTKD